MKTSITFNLKNYYNMEILAGLTGWSLFDRLRKVFGTCPGAVSSPQMDNTGRIKQPRIDRELWKAQRANNPVVVEYGTRRGYTAITFTF